MSLTALARRTLDSALGNHLVGREIADALDGATDNVLAAGEIFDANGNANGFTLDADADTAIYATTDDQIEIKQNGVKTLATAISSGMTFAAATDTAGQDVYIQAADAGASATTARTGAALELRTGDGSAGATTVAGGVGGAMTVVAGAGGAKTGTGAAAGGAGGATAVTAGAGGATASSGADNGGAGGGVTVTAGVGGAASAGTGNGGAGGTITLAPGAGGASAGGVAGAPGKVKLNAGTLHFTNGQTIDMNDAQVALTLVPGTPTGTLLTSNTLFVDANSGGTEDLLLPPEANCNGLVLHIANTGGEDIIVKEDSDSTTIATVSTAESATVFCNGTTWFGGVLKAT